MDSDERFHAPAAAIVEDLRDELLARAALTGDQHRRVAWREGFNLSKQACERGRLSDQAASRFRLGDRVPRALELRLEPAMLSEPLHALDELAQLERFGQIIGGAFFER